MTELDNQDYFIRATEVAQKLTIAKSTLYLWISQGFFLSLLSLEKLPSGVIQH